MYILITALLFVSVAASPSPVQPPQGQPNHGDLVCPKIQPRPRIIAANAAVKGERAAACTALARSFPKVAQFLSIKGPQVDSVRAMRHHVPDMNGGAPARMFQFFFFVRNQPDVIEASVDRDTGEISVYRSHH